MTIRVYQTYELDEMISNIEVQSPFLLGRYFGRVKSFQTEQIEWDIIDRGRRIAPFVSPLVPGRVMRRPGYRTTSLKPAYIKLADLIRPTDTFTRLPGEAYGGALSPMARLDRIVAETLQTHREARDVRMEWMASSALFNGFIDVTGEDYPPVRVNFGRDPALTITLTGTALWSNPTTADPISDLELGGTLVRKKSRGSVVQDAVMNGVTWAALRNIIQTNLSVGKLYSTQVRLMNGSTFDLGPRKDVQAEYVGNFSGRFDLWVYDGFYNDDLGADQAFVPDGKVLLIGGGIEGTQYHGAILDIDANMEPREYFVKTWIEKDPSGLNLLSQSAPLVGPRRPNASAVLNVL